MPKSAGSPDAAGSRLTLDIWHPNCWTLKVTDEMPGGLFGHGVYNVGEKVKGRFTVYGETQSELEECIEAIEASPLTDSVWEMDYRYTAETETSTPGNATKSLLVEYDEHTSISNALVSNGFIPDKPVWIHDGREYWTVIINKGRDQVQARLDEVREKKNAEIDIQQIVSDDTGSGGVMRSETLSERQREVFELARDQGYYNWPREVTATELASGLGVSKATLLEHLRKAESKLVGSML